MSSPPGAGKAGNRVRAVPGDPPRVGMVSLGCPKALTDSEVILSRLRAEGYGVAAEYTGADVVIINTCGFIEAAIDESMAAIGEAMAEHGRVIVTGCLGVDAERVRAAHPQVLAVTGPHAADEVLDHLHRFLPRPHDPRLELLPPGGLRLTPRHYAYLKVAEGCDHACTFCIIPTLRGAMISRPPDDILREAEALARAGVREINLIAQDTAAWGQDFRSRTAFVAGRPVQARLPGLLRELSGLGLWLRLLYVYPHPVVDELVDLMAEGRVLPYLDMPLQHASRPLLRAMRRPADRERVLERIRAWRQRCPELVLRSTFIVGFPGETDADFEELLAFVEEAGIDRLGCFVYSPVAGAAANALPGAVPEAVALERQRRLMELQENLSAERLEARVGSAVRVLVDEVGDDGIIGRSYGEAPEIDGVIYVADDGRPVAAGEVIDVEIEEAGIHDLWAARL